MQCVRCKHELPPRADRCVRCFALNPANAPAVAWTMPQTPPPPKIELSFSDERPSVDPQVAITEPLPAPREVRRSVPRERPAPRASRQIAALPQIELPLEIREEIRGHNTDLPVAHPPVAAKDPVCVPGFLARCVAWAIDGALLAATVAGFVALSTAVVGPSRLAPHGIGSRDYWLDLLLSPHLPALWTALCVMLAVAYTGLFGALGGRTPGLALTRLRVVSLDGGRVRPLAACVRAVWAVPSAALGLFGFALAAFDARGQTLHDKLSRTLVVADS